MVPMKKHLSKKWEVSLIALAGTFKVTRRLPDLTVSETKIFASKEEAQKQFDKWLE